MKYIQLTAPAAEPVTVAEVKTHLRLETTADDTMIGSIIIPAVRDFAEKHTRACIAQRTFTAVFDPMGRRETSLTWWDGVREGSISTTGSLRTLELPMSPLVSIDEVRTIDTNNVSTEFDSLSYYADTFSEPGNLVLNEGSDWPTNLRRQNAIEVDFTAGYLAADTPYMIKQALLQLCAHWYENHELVELGTIAARVPVTAMSILDRFKVRSL